jgi:transposase
MSSGQGLSMRTIREVLRLGLTTELSFRDIGRSLRLSHPTVQKYIQTAKRAGLTWPQVQAMAEDELGKAMEVTEEPVLATNQRPMPDCAYIHQEMKKKSVTLGLLWQEYKDANPNGYQLTQYRRFYRRFVKKLKLSMRQTYKFGEKLFVDYAGQTVPIHDRVTGAVSQAQIFVAVLGASNYAYAEATADQSLASWIGSHGRTYEYMQGVTQQTVCDNLKAGVTSPCRYEPDINLAYAEMASHYGTVIMPARVRQPRDKAKVETCVQIVERWILAALRNRKFFSLSELNEAIRELLVKLNQKSFQKLEGSRESLFKKFELPALKPLPCVAYEFAQWKKARVNIDYHFEIDGAYYSAPYVLVHEELAVRYTSRIVEAFYKGKRVASHVRSHRCGHFETINEHRPKGHQEHLEWTPSKIIAYAKAIGPRTAQFVTQVLESRRFPEQGYRSCLGVIRLAKSYPKERIEAACERAMALGALAFKSVNTILKNKMDLKPHVAHGTTLNIHHENIRGGDYFLNHQQN